MKENCVQCFEETPTLELSTGWREVHIHVSGASSATKAPPVLLVDAPVCSLECAGLFLEAQGLHLARIGATIDCTKNVKDQSLTVWTVLCTECDDVLITSALTKTLLLPLHSDAAQSTCKGILKVLDVHMARVVERP